MASSETFRPDDVGARQRGVHWATAAASLLFFVGMGAPGLVAYLVGLLLLHVRTDTVRGYNVMEHLLRTRESDLTREWNAFFGATHRRAMSLAGQKPHRFLATAGLVALLVLVAVLGALVGDASVAVAMASRLGIALVASAALWIVLFGPSRRTPLVFGTDGVRVGESFVPYASVIGVESRGSGVVIERSSPLSAVFVRTSDVETADRLMSLLTSERDRARERGAEPSPPLPAAGFRESASHVGWRVRLLDATSDEERHAVIARVSPDELRELVDETADPSLEDALQAQLRRATTSSDDPRRRDPRRRGRP